MCAAWHTEQAGEHRAVCVYIFLRGYQPQRKRCLWRSSPVEGRDRGCAAGGTGQEDCYPSTVSHSSHDRLTGVKQEHSPVFTELSISKNRRTCSLSFYLPGGTQPGPKVPDSRPLSLPTCDPARLGPSPWGLSLKACSMVLPCGE